ncbi:hypothetical protein [Streptomyces acidiscabies]|uniref:Secreted protein n=1 Tax=Streptomyces acidiscabies TaxID=42234 RepID=A0AAP6BK35_9ACTN|nr:hypothetical protein [Streptomyces acidiscabies]MBP5941200.1 hypothetical protein [Streptomyces sp. LBUM 1476]MBZ3912528.1 hypothetical protein [Streptomyces acidiscabies]MDX2966040.1 hypothetical protein [Streptomyces acidiscabies]MDX3025498.1 hypothetical protein [Streptomyces acidiscabies]MDX3796075.1 hypothetical protein [Streptomyces acidiscabies]
MRAQSATKPLKRFGKAASAVAALAFGASLLAAPQAMAEDTPSTRQLLDACSWADLCEFHPQSYWTYTGPAHQVGSTAYNCGSQTNQHSINWSDTTGTTNSVGVSVSSGVKFFEVFEAEISANYGHSWQASHTDGETDTVNVPPGHKGWIERGTPKQQATGWYEIHFGSRYYGHYIWYVHDYQSSGFYGDNWRLGYVNQKDAPMASWERNQHCR